MVDMNQLDKKIRSYCDENKIFGAVRVTIADRVVYDARLGYADIASKRPFTDDSMFTFYSMSKPFCAIGFLKLYDRGLVDLDAHPGKYIPEAANFDERVTLRMMLGHISGLPDFQENREYLEDPAPRTTPESQLPPSDTRRILFDMSRLTELPLHFEPGTGDWYANINIITPAIIIEKITGQTYADYMKKEVFEPLGMKNALIDTPDLILADRVTGYELNEEGNPVPIDRLTDWMKGAGDIIGTVDDMYCVNKAIKHRLLLRPETWEMALTPNKINSMGMGCTVTEWHGKHRITHNGGHLGFRTFHVQLTDDDFDIIILSNSGYGNARNDLTEIIHTEFYGADDKLEKMPEWDKGFAN